MTAQRKRSIVVAVALLVLSGGRVLHGLEATQDEKGDQPTMLRLMYQLASVEEAYYQAIAPRGATGDMETIAAQYKTIVEKASLYMESVVNQDGNAKSIALQSQLLAIHSKALERLQAIAELQALQRQTGGKRRAGQ